VAYRVASGLREKDFVFCNSPRYNFGRSFSLTDWVDFMAVIYDFGELGK